MGRVFKPKYAWTKADGTRVEKITAAWYVEYTDATGKWIRRKAGTTKEQAADVLRKAEADVLAEKNGLPVQRAADLLCTELVRTYLAARAPHVSRKQTVILTQRLKEITRRTKAAFVKQLTPERVEACLQELADEGLAQRTQNCYLQAIKGMLNWAVRRRKLPYNPLDCVSPRPELEKRRVRRALTEEEITRVLAAAAEGPMRRKLKVYQNRPRKDKTYKPADVPLKIQAAMAEEGRHMVLIYRIMLETGLRRGEVRALTWADLDLDAGTLTTRPEWEGNKNGKCETLPLPPGLLATLKARHQQHTGSDQAPVVKVTSRLLRCFDNDLIAAGIAKHDAAGRVLDLHALRHTYGTRLVATGVDIKTVQALMRHSSPELTLGIYVHTDRGRLHDAVRRLPDLAAAYTPVIASASEATARPEVA